MKTIKDIAAVIITTAVIIGLFVGLYYKGGWDYVFTFIDIILIAVVIDWGMQRVILWFL